jgi:hypothetical protein
MNKNRLNVPTEFAAETRFELRPAVTAPFRAVHENGFERLKNKLLARELTTATVPGITAAFRRAANEAAAIAWNTDVPLLVFPGVFEEKIAAAVLRAERQARVFKNSRELVVVA